MDSVNIFVIRLIIADNQPLVRHGIRSILEQTPDIDVVGEAANGADVMDLVTRLRPNIVLLDMELSGPCAGEVSSWICQHHPETIGLAFSAQPQGAQLAEMLDAGVVGHLDKTLPPSQIVQAIRRAAQGESLFSAEQLLHAHRWCTGVQACWNDLTQREHEVLRLLAQGINAHEIAQRLCISPHTVDTHLRNLTHKLKVSNRIEAIAWAWNNGLVEKSQPQE